MRLCLLCLLALTAWSAESFSATFTATPAGGQYWNSKTGYVLAVWVEGPSSTTRIATIYGTRGEGTNLSQWKAKGGNQNNASLAVDGVMGATLNSSTARTRTVTWDLTTPYRTGSTTLVADGSYQIWLESVDANNPTSGTASVPGANRFHFTFVRDGVSRSAAPITDAAGKFTSITYSCTGRAPTIANPALSIITNATTTFTATSNAAVTPTSYQWRRAGTNVGTNSSTYTIASATLGDAGSYDCVVTYPNTYGLGTAPTMTSNALTLVVTSGSVAVTGSAITPASSTVNPGTAVTLTNTPTPANATSPVYAWYSNTSNSTSGGSLIAGQILGTYSPPTASAGTVWYYGTITAGGATVTCPAAVQVTVRSAPTISVQPTSTTVAAGGTANFAITASANGHPNLNYQWQSNTGSGWANLGGATAGTYSTTTLVNATQYRCVLTNASGAGVTTTSGTATLTAFLPPTITTDTSPLNPSALAGSAVNLSVAATIPGTPAGSLSYQWQYRSSAAGTFANVGGATAATRAVTASVNGEQYRCILTNTVNAVTATTTTRTTTITVAAPAAPVFTTQPAPTSVFAGATASFTVAITGVPTPTLQWSDSPDNVTFTPIGGATAGTYTTAATSIADVGVPRYYRCTATNGSGSVNSTAALRTVTGAPSGIAYINFTSSASAGAYGPDKHVLAAWIQNGSTFVTTLGDWSGERKSSLVLWNSVSGGADAVMGATRLSHRQVGNLTWTFDPAGTPDGTYSLWLESADDNQGPIGAPSGSPVPGANRMPFDFTISGGAVVEATGAGGGFSGIRVSAFFDPTAATADAGSGPVQDAGKVASCGSGGLFALILAGGLMLALRRRRN